MPTPRTVLQTLRISTELTAFNAKCLTTMTSKATHALYVATQWCSTFRPRLVLPRFPRKWNIILISMIIQHPTMQELHPSITNPFLTAQQKNPFSIILTVSLVLDHSTSTLMTISVKHVTKALPSIKYRSSVKSQSSKKKYLEALSIPMLQIIMENLLNSVHHPTEIKEPQAAQII